MKLKKLFFPLFLFACLALDAFGSGIFAPGSGAATGANGDITSMTGLTGELSTPTGIKGSNGFILYPTADGTASLLIKNAAKSSTILTIDTTNKRLGVNKAPGAFDLDVNGAVNFASTLAVTGHLTLEGVTSTGATGTGKLVFDTTPSFTTSLKTPAITVPSDSTTAFQVFKADGSTRVVDVDTSNARVGINKTPGSFDLDVNGKINSGSSITATAYNGTTASGIFNFATTQQSQAVVSGTEYYITNSNLNMPASYTTAIGAGTTMRWKLAMTKTAAGTGTFQILLKKGTNGSTADTTLATATIGTQTAVLDALECDVILTWTSATAAYWTVIPRQFAATGTGFGFVYPAAAQYLTGTISGQTTTTASDKYGLSFVSTTGTPTILISEVSAQAFGVD